ncbi:MAG: hypothetical protein MHMPM18_001843 [Marteilia pararefringens]
MKSGARNISLSIVFSLRNFSHQHFFAPCANLFMIDAESHIISLGCRLEHLVVLIGPDKGPVIADRHRLPIVAIEKQQQQ